MLRQIYALPLTLIVFGVERARRQQHIRPRLGISTFDRYQASKRSSSNNHSIFFVLLFFFFFCFYFSSHRLVRFLKLYFSPKFLTIFLFQKCSFGISSSLYASP